MALKIVGRSPRMQITESRQKPVEAKGATLHCDTCNRDFAVVFPYGATKLKRQQLVKAAADNHRKIGCTGGRAEDRRVYTMDYQRD